MLVAFPWEWEVNGVLPEEAARQYLQFMSAAAERLQAAEGGERTHFLQARGGGV